jgi:MoaA/NifB/PqqE/SkfB family radical SAM enzyme
MNTKLLNNTNTNELHGKLIALVLGKKTSPDIGDKIDKFFDNLRKINASAKFIKDNIFYIIDTKILKPDETNIIGGDKWIEIINKHIQNLTYDDCEQATLKIIKYYTNEYILKPCRGTILKLHKYIQTINDIKLFRPVLFHIIYDVNCQPEPSVFFKLIKAFEYMVFKIEPKYQNEMIERVYDYYLKQGYTALAVKFICKVIEHDDTNSDFICKFRLPLVSIPSADKKKILKLLNHYNKSSKKIRASNIFLNESEIIRNKILTELKNTNNNVAADSMLKTTDILCNLIKNNSSDIELTRHLSIILRKHNLGTKKEDILKILTNYYKNSKNARAANIFLNEIEIIQKKVILKSKPRIMIPQVTTHCNLKCIMCGQHSFAPYELNDKQVNYLIQNMPYFEQVLWQGGEVFLYKNFRRLMDTAHKHKVHQLITTNGLLLNKRLIALMAKNDIMLSISIDATNKELYEKIRINGNFEKLINNLNILKQYKSKATKLRTMMSVIVMSINYHQIKELIDFAISYGFGKIRFQQYMFNYTGQNLSPSRDQLQQALQTISLFQEKYKNKEIRTEIENALSLDNSFVNAMHEGCNNSTSNEEFERNDVNGLYCIAPWTTLCFFNHNSIKPSCTSHSLKVNLNEDFWNAKSIIEYRTKILNNDFTSCNKECYNLGFDGERTRLGIQ